MRSVLIIDDDSDIRGLVGAIVGAGEQRCIIEATNGEMGLQMFRESDFDLVILDVMMPGMSGHDVLKELRLIHREVPTPVLMLTARDALSDVVCALDDGADDYITKPFRHEELRARVDALLRVRNLTELLHEKSEELRSAQEALVRHEKAKVAVDFSATAAHELGQPLSAMILYLHLLSEEALDKDTAQNALVELKNQTKVMTDIVDKLRSIDPESTESYYGSSNLLKFRSKP